MFEKVVRQSYLYFKNYGTGMEKGLYSLKGTAWFIVLTFQRGFCEYFNMVQWYYIINDRILYQ